MNVFKINENTIGYAETRVSSNGSRKIFILQTGVGDWDLTKTVEVRTPNNIWDICYMKMLDGTPCLLLCIPYGHRIMAMRIEDGKEMVRGRTKWEIGKKQMGEKFNPWSICTDGTNGKPHHLCC